MRTGVVLEIGGDNALLGAALPARSATEAPVETPQRPDIETDPNRQPDTTEVPEPGRTPCRRPKTSCPVE